MYKYIDRMRKNSHQEKEQCQSNCDKCAMCETETRDNSDCWDSCDKCNRCYAQTKVSKTYNEPYEYYLGYRNNKIPYSKAYCNNICGVRLCNSYRELLKQGQNVTNPMLTNCKIIPQNKTTSFYY